MFFIVVRRSTRTRKGSYEAMSWLADNQMSKVGYPNFDSTEYSEDSRDAQVYPSQRKMRNCCKNSRNR